ncbi:MAG: fatty acid desaturase [Bacteroidetes bacterium]|jgi:fatty acid desaturase|nr:fatty acid desaturase [Bacteroidota bacterium]MBX7129710.1 fatty acid desaturase [Flavobacteriales bacterium]MCC6654621.1 fatty acid desaturase [Flavobacteriales bacterium]HMU12403.1 fatty acid desaturase [Flavobacteriales bacterium]HMW97370.1 fatty acid desaturase [Flavobacteriales bacterium]
MTIPPVITDPVYDPATRHSALDRFFLRLIRDPRDLPFVYLGLRVSLLLIPMAVLLYMPFVTGWIWWAIALVYLWINNITLKGPFGLMLHCTTHRAFFKKEYGLLNHYYPWVLAPLFGQSPETYRAHHVGMHHVENNLEPDESSTMPYRRDSGRDFLRYYFRFLFTGIFTLSFYLFGHNRKKLAWQAIRGEILFVVFCTVMCFVNAPATIVAFIIPFLAFRLVAMAGNWTQHTFIDPQDPGNHFTNSITCINTKFNHRCWNDGYHISHHIDPTMHWTEHPKFFLENLAEFGRQKAVVFTGLNYVDVFTLLLRDRYDTLADHFVDAGGHFTGRKDELIAFLRSRTVPIPFTHDEELPTAA